jgi:ABC-type Fe3+-hydroxamate transport system substrate-binding protein
MRRWVAICACALLLSGACADQEPASEGSPSAAPTEAPETPADPGGPAISIVAPEDGATLEAGDVVVNVSIESFELVDKLGQDPVQGEGHVHYYFDVDEIPTTPGRPAVPTDPDAYYAVATTEYPWSSVDAGRHTFAVQLVNNDHTPLEPPVTDEVTVTVESR